MSELPDVELEELDSIFVQGCRRREVREGVLVLVGCLRSQETQEVDGRT